MLDVNKTELVRHHVPVNFADRFAYGATRCLSAIAGGPFSRRYGDRVIVMETIAAVLPMVAATLLHLKCLRRMIDDRGWVRTFMDEAENQRAHLMSFVAIQRPGWFERLVILLSQGFFYNAYFLLHLVSAYTAHRMIGYLAEWSVGGYSRLLERIESGMRADDPAPAVAIAYWNLPADARLSDMVIAMREDEAIHRDIHHGFADALAGGKALPDLPGPQV